VLNLHTNTLANSVQNSAIAKSQTSDIPRYVHRLATHLENLEESQNLKVVREKSGKMFPSGFPCLLESPGFFPKISTTWKVLQNEFGPGKSWKLKFKVLEVLEFTCGST